MPAPWLLLAMALTLTLTEVPGGRAQLEAAQQEAATPEHAGLEGLLRQAERLLLLREELRQLQLRGDQGDHESESQIFQPDWLSKRQHPGKREEEAEGKVEEEEEGEAVGLHKRPPPGRQEAAVWSVDVTQQKRQHPGRRSSWLEHTFTKRQHPGRRLVDTKAQRSWEEEEDGEEEEEGELIPEKRQHPGKRALGGPCGLQRACGQASLLLGLLGDLSRSQGAEEKRQHPGRRAAWAGEPLEE